MCASGCSDIFQMFVIYENPSDYPGKFVVRRWEVDSGDLYVATECVVVETLKQAREAIPPGLYRLNRNCFDDPVIVETWI